MGILCYVYYWLVNWQSRVVRTLSLPYLPSQLKLPALVNWMNSLCYSYYQH